jgi:hypothetical protein
VAEPSANAAALSTNIAGPALDVSQHAVRPQAEQERRPMKAVATSVSRRSPAALSPPATSRGNRTISRTTTGPERRACQAGRDQGGDLAAIEQRLEDDHGATDGDDAAEEEGLGDWPAEEPAEADAGGQGERHLDDRADHGDAADAGEFRE